MVLVVQWCETPRPSGEAWWCEHPAVAYHCRSLATVRQPKSLRLPAQKCEKHFKTQYMGKYVGVIRKAYRTYMCKFGKYWDIGINVLNMIQYGIYVVLAWSFRKASNVLSESYCQNGLAILAQAFCQQTLESLKFALLPSPLHFAFQLWPRWCDGGGRPPLTLDSETLSEGSFQLVDQLTEITTEDYQMAEQVAETNKNEEDAASLTLSGAPLDGWLRNASECH